MILNAASKLVNCTEIMQKLIYVGKVQDNFLKTILRILNQNLILGLFWIYEFQIKIFLILLIFLKKLTALTCQLVKNNNKK